MKFPAFPTLARCSLLALLTWATFGCAFLAKREHTQIGKPTPVPTPVPPVPGATPPPFPVEDRKFLTIASEAIAFHKRLGAMARQYGHSDEVRNLGADIEGQMNLAQEALKVLATTKTQPVGTEVGNWGRGGLGRLARPGSEGFDHEFYEVLKQSGTLAFEDFDHFFRTMTDQQIKEFARNWYPIFRDYPRVAIKAEAPPVKKRSFL